MRILILNCGSSSVKYQFIDSLTEQVMAEGIAEKIGEAVSLFTYKTRSFQKKKQQMPIPDHEKAIALIIDELVNNQHGVIRDMAEIEAVGHRLVHAGEYYSDSVVIDDHVIEVMEECSSLALLHNPPNLKGVYTYRIKKYIGAYTAAMNGLDVLIFTGGVGENMPILRAETCRDLDFLGIILDERKNHQSADGILELNKAVSRVKILKIPTNEELMIARETERLLKHRSHE